MQTLGGWMAMLALWALPAAAQPSSPPALTLTFAGETETVFTPKRDACDGNDVPDAPLRAFHDAVLDSGALPLEPPPSPPPSLQRAGESFLTKPLSSPFTAPS